MSIVQALIDRSGDACELCSSKENLTAYSVAPSEDTSENGHAYLCPVCQSQIKGDEKVNVNHWRCLNDSMWSTVPAVQVLAYRMLSQLKNEGWPQDLLDMLYLEESTLTWATALDTPEDDINTVVHKDSNGVVLSSGDTVVLIKDLNVKGASFTAKRGTAVRGISLVHDNPEHIEGRVNGQQIVILTQYVKKN